MIEVREGGLGDLRVVGELHTLSRQAAYRGIIADDVLARIDPADITQAWRERYEPTRDRFFIAEVDGVAAGFSFVGEGLLRAIHVLPQWYGSGAGSRLMLAAREGLRELGFRRANLWVIEENTRARRFYERDGWVPSGQVRDRDVSGGMTHQLEYVRDL